ncbi:MAG TPA: hypothetical protein VF053_20170 [Streptosporangiales bacterium]
MAGLAADDELNAAQLAAMDALWNAERNGEVSASDARAIERVIRLGHPYGARKRLTAARRRHAEESK